MILVQVRFLDDQGIYSLYLHLTEFPPAHHSGVVSIVAPINVGQTDRPDVVIKLNLKQKN